LLFLYFGFECIYFLVNVASSRLPPVQPAHQPHQGLHQPSPRGDDVSIHEGALFDLKASLTKNVRLRKVFERILKLRDTLVADSSRFDEELRAITNLTKKSEGSAARCIRDTDKTLKRGLSLEGDGVATMKAVQKAIELRDWEASIMAKIHDVRERTLEQELKHARDVLSSGDDYKSTLTHTVISRRDLKEVILPRAPFSYPNVSILTLEDHTNNQWMNTKKEKKIVGLSGVRNAVRQLSHFVASLSRVVDSIVLLDDTSDDGTARLAEELMMLSTQPQRNGLQYKVGTVHSIVYI